jgi:hypothetical protein
MMGDHNRLLYGQNMERTIMSTSLLCLRIFSLVISRAILQSLINSTDLVEREILLEIEF